MTLDRQACEALGELYGFEFYDRSCDGDLLRWDASWVSGAPALFVLVDEDPVEWRWWSFDGPGKPGMPMTPLRPEDALETIQLALHRLKTGQALRVGALIDLRPGIDGVEIAEELDLSYRMTGRAVQQLCEAGQIEEATRPAPRG